MTYISRPFLRHLNEVVSIIMILRLTVPLEPYKLRLYVVESVKSVNIGSVVMNIILWSCFINCQIYVCLSSTSHWSLTFRVYKLLHTHNVDYAGMLLL